MSEAPYNTTNPVFNPRVMWQVTGIALAAVALLGIIVNAIAGNNIGLSGFLVFDWMHNIVHVLLAAVAIIFGFGNIAGSVSKVFAIVVGAVYLLLAVGGFITGDLLGFLGLTLELGENLVHLLIGAWALTSGLVAKY